PPLRYISETPSLPSPLPPPPPPPPNFGDSPLLPLPVPTFQILPRAPTSATNNPPPPPPPFPNRQTTNLLLLKPLQPQTTSSPSAQRAAQTANTPTFASSTDSHNISLPRPGASTSKIILSLTACLPKPKNGETTRRNSLLQQHGGLMHRLLLGAPHQQQRPHP